MTKTNTTTKAKKQDKTKAITKAKTCEEGSCLKTKFRVPLYNDWKIIIKNFLLIFNLTLKV